MRIAFAATLAASVAVTPCIAQNNRANCIRLSDTAAATVAEMDALRPLIEKQRFDGATSSASGNIRDATIEVDDARKKMIVALREYVAVIGRLRLYSDFCAGQ